MRFPRPTLLLLCSVVATGLLAGCGGSSSGGRAKQVPHVKAIAAMYMSAASSLQRNPASADEFKQTITARKPNLSVLGVSSIDELFVSDRDGKPLVILYGDSSGSSAQGVVVYEQEGVDGVRLIGSSNGEVGTADAAQFAKLALKPPAPQ